MRSIFHYGIDLEMNKLKRSTHFQRDSSTCVPSVMRERGWGKTKKNEQTRRKNALHLCNTRGFKAFSHLGCNLSRKSLPGMFLLDELIPPKCRGLCHDVVTSLSLSVRWMWVMISVLSLSSVWPWINYNVSECRFLLWKLRIMITALQVDWPHKWAWHMHIIPTQWITVVNSYHCYCYLALQAEWILSSYL